MPNHCARLYKAGTGSSVEEDHARTEETQQINAAEEVEAAEEEGLLCGERGRRVETTRGSEEVEARGEARRSGIFVCGGAERSCCSWGARAAAGGTDRLGGGEVGGPVKEEEVCT
ncbi:hypothetical protein Scep_030583 [Stephania cephalantha]|uniref:Uncharacterized protein n=1 Tax=Stephania cephalantha TaxID=152367 RepID=A0AAP0E3C3_9MAGN